MRYLLLMHVPREGDYRSDLWPAGDAQAHYDYWRRLNAELKERGELVEVKALAPPGESRTVRAGSDGLPVVTDGPFAEAKEFLAGFWTVEVDSPERALRIAATASAVPGRGGAPLGLPIEVRRVGSAPLPDA
ncbi:MAG: YciI family protein [Gemmatimonadota bacterium]